MPAFVRIFNPLPQLRRPTAKSLCTTTATLDQPIPPPAIACKTKFVVLSDLHVRRESIDTALQVLHLAHTAALERNAAVLFLGDFWHARGALPVDPLNRVLTHLSQWSVPLLMIPGNHDLITRAGTGVSLVPLATTLGHSRCMLLTRPSLALDALWLPYTHDDHALKSILAETAALQTPPEAIFCHVEVAGARLAGSLISRDRHLHPTDFPNHARVYSGHLHRPHTVGPVQYVGSPYQVSAAEAGQNKMLFVLDRMKSWQIIERIPIDVGPRHFIVDYAAPHVLPNMRSGDRISVLSARGDNARRFVTSLREQDIRVEVVSRGDGTKVHAVDDDVVDVSPRISPGGVSNGDLFRRYTEIKNLGEGVCKMGLELLGEVSSRMSASSGKDVVVKWDSVSLNGFGTFFDPVEYPLSDRGLVLVTGCDCDEDGSLSGRTNATGKTTLVMATLWAWTGRTDPRPDGSVEKGVSLEMVHDDAKSCEVVVKARLYGHRVCSEAAEMMSPEQRLDAELVNAGNNDGENFLHVEVTRSSTRNGSASKARSYRQALCLKINGVDLSCLDVKETQNRIDRLVDGTLLPHTVFFGQHMGAARGLLDGTDRMLKDHLALIFPLDVWREARKVCRAKLATLHEKQVSSEASLNAAKGVLSRLESSEIQTRKQVDDYEMDRAQRLAALNQSFLDAVASRCDVLQDSVAFSESLAVTNSIDELSSVIEDLKKAVRFVDQTDGDELDQLRVSVAEQVARAKASVETDRELESRVEALIKKAEERQQQRLTVISDIRKYRAEIEKELKEMEDAESLDKRWKSCVSELNTCDQKLQELVDLNVQKTEGTLSDRFSHHLVSVDSARKRASHVRDEKVSLETSLRNIRIRLSQSEEFAIRAPNANHDPSPSSDSYEDSNLMTCEKCLRPFDGELFESARKNLMHEVRSMEMAIRETEKRVEQEDVALEKAMRMLTDHIDKEKNEIAATKKTVTGELSKLRSLRETRESLSREVEKSRLRLFRSEQERNVYIEELLSLDLGLLQYTNDVVKVQSFVSETIDKRKRENINHLRQAEKKYNDVLLKVKDRELRLLETTRNRRSLEIELDDMMRLYAKCSAIENERNGTISEGNPFEESLRILQTELQREAAIVKKREDEFQKLSDSINTLKAVDVAFGPRGVPSFVLEEGLMWLETLTGKYLRELSDGELVFQMRAFSDYKTTRTDENKEVISKRVFVRKKSSDEMRERTLRQLSGGQRRRCSLSFALAFADLAYERAGFQSSMIVLDEVLQSMDADGRYRVGKVLPQLMKGSECRDSIFVVAQDEAPEISGLATGGIDVVERRAERSCVVIDGKIGGEGLQ